MVLCVYLCMRDALYGVWASEVLGGGFRSRQSKLEGFQPTRIESALKQTRCAFHECFFDNKEVVGSSPWSV